MTRADLAATSVINIVRSIGSLVSFSSIRIVMSEPNFTFVYTRRSSNISTRFFSEQLLYALYLFKKVNASCLGRSITEGICLLSCSGMPTDLFRRTRIHFSRTAKRIAVRRIVS